MRLNRSELARAYQVSLPTIDAWVLRDCPRVSAGGPGVPSIFDWEDVAYWVHMYKSGPRHSDPDVWIGEAYHRAVAIVQARTNRTTRKLAR